MSNSSFERTIFEPAGSAENRSKQQQTMQLLKTILKPKLSRRKANSMQGIV
jgi:hypothetical protein